MLGDELKKGIVKGLGGGLLLGGLRRFECVVGEDEDIGGVCGFVEGLGCLKEWKVVLRGFDDVDVFNWKLGFLSGVRVGMECEVRLVLSWDEGETGALCRLAGMVGLVGVEVEDAGFVHGLFALRGLRSLREVSLKDCQVGKSELVAFVKECKSLESFYVGNCFNVESLGGEDCCHISGDLDDFFYSRNVSCCHNSESEDEWLDHSE